MVRISFWSISFLLLVVPSIYGQKKEAEKSLFATPNSFSVEAGTLPNFVFRTPPFEIGYLSLNFFGKSTMIVTPKLSIGVAGEYSTSIVNRINPNTNFPKNTYGLGAFARYKIVGKQSSLYAFAGPHFRSFRLPKTLDTFQAGQLYPFAQMGLGGMLKVGNGLYVTANYIYTIPFNREFKSSLGLNAGMAYYFNRDYTDLPKKYKERNVKERSSDFLVSLGVGYFPFEAEDFGETYNLFMVNAKITYNLNNTFSVGAMGLINFDHANSVGSRTFPHVGPIIQANLLNKKAFRLNIFTGLLFSNYFIPTEGLPYYANMNYLPIGFGVSRKVSKSIKGLFLDVNFAQNIALFGAKPAEGNASFWGLGIRYDYLNRD